jgi:hypothetical protein
MAMQTQRATLLARLAMFAGSLTLAACGDDVDGGTANSSQGQTSSGTSGSSTGGTTGDTTGTGGPTTSGTSATGSSGTTGAPPTTDGTSATNGTSATTADPPPNDCCIPHMTPGCADKEVEACVCGNDLTCCVPDHGWDETCIKEVNSLGCGMCEMALPH